MALTASPDNSPVSSRLAKVPASATMVLRPMPWVR